MEYHHYANLFPLLERKELQELTEDIRANGQQEAIWLYEGKILDGRNRHRACVLLGIEPVTKDYTGNNPLDFVVSLNFYRRHLSSEQRACVAVDLLPVYEKEAKKRKQSGVKQDNHEEKIPHGRRAPQARKRVADALKTNERYVQDLKKIKAEDPKTFEEIKAGKKKLSEVKSGKPSIVTLYTGDEEHYTPTRYIESARRVMGCIDLDPASNPVAQETVKAARYFTKEDDGLQQQWSGNVWLNPPYTARVINQFVDKLVKHYQDGDIDQAVLLTNNSTDTNWFRSAAEQMSAICFTHGRISFYKNGIERTSPTNGQAFFYFGPNEKAFRDEFSAYGKVLWPDAA